MPKVEIDGQVFEADNGAMVIEVADANGVSIPRFCYHKKLSVAANCRMCLVEVENARKPMPACATPVMDGMKVFTRSPLALSAQKNIMEFLLINHPLDCPICDQGGECELQDVSLTYGQDTAFYSEGKRAVEDEDLGSLISTEMTRCIHCTRCVRFGDEVAGFRELGATGRGESMKIGTYVKNAVASEVSGNIIDLCPVGALTSKPYRFTARSWELQQKKSIAPHDCLGSHINIHVRRNQVMRVVPEENESINETWLSDRDRFAYTGLYQDRVSKPLIKEKGVWKEVDWQKALTTAVERMKAVLGANGRHEFGALSSSYATTEELYLLQKFFRALGINHIDHRVTQQDFRDDAHLPLFPGSNGAYADFSKQEAVLLIGSDIQREQPLAAVRLRQAQKEGASLSSLNAFPLNCNLDLKTEWYLHPKQFANTLAKVLKAAYEIQSTQIPTEWHSLLATIATDEQSQKVARDLIEAKQSLLVLGLMAEVHEEAATLRALAKAIAKITQSKIALMTHGPNQAGACLAGALPHRGPAGRVITEPGCNAHQMSLENKKGYLLLHLEPEFDCLDGSQMLRSLNAAETVIAVTAFDSPHLREYADVILPASAFSETSGTFVNMEGTWQSFRGAVKPYGESRPAWKILRVLANLIDLEGFDFCSSEEILNELKSICDKHDFVEPQSWLPQEITEQNDEIVRVGRWGIYSSDPLQRRSYPLQQSASNDQLAIHVSPNVAKKYNLRQGKEACALQNKGEAHLTVVIDERLPSNCVYLPTGFDQTVGLGALCAKIELK